MTNKMILRESPYDEVEPISDGSIILYSEHFYMYHYVRLSQIRSQIYITTECHSNSLPESCLHYQDETAPESTISLVMQS